MIWSQTMAMTTTTATTEKNVKQKATHERSMRWRIEAKKSERERKRNGKKENYICREIYIDITIIYVCIVCMPFYMYPENECATSV